VSSSSQQTIDAVKRSALWAAYGDALGFIAEFADSASVERRTGARHIERTLQWQRRVGGQFGVTASLPAGAISDDTQLRLATCRSILPNGSFDVEAFSKIELPVWLAYALGAGRGSRAAATHLARRDTTWASNFFGGRGTDYVRGGGNGAAMRIQPHVWAGSHRNSNETLRDVLINALCTHGHPRGFLGAYFHAYCLGLTLAEGRTSGPADWRHIVHTFPQAGELLRNEETLRDLWITPWEQRFEQPLDKAIAEVGAEMLADIAKVEQIRSTGRGAFRTAVEDLELYVPDQRGSGTKTALLAAWVALLYSPDAEQGVLACANALGTDTDTIATMAGALLGPLADTVPEGAIQDARYIEREAERMWAIGEGRAVPAFPFVDLLSWVPPRTQSDVVGHQHGELAVAGLGPAIGRGESWSTGGREQAEFGWLTLWFGQQVLAKRRHEPADLPRTATVSPDPGYREAPLADAPPRRVKTSPAIASRPRRTPAPQRTQTMPDFKPQDAGQAALPLPQTEQDNHVRIEQDWLAVVKDARTMNELTDAVIRSGFDPLVVGAGLLKSINHVDDGIERSAIYTAIIAKARMARDSKPSASDD
jgi:ADP-ribosylglycohydrolase